MKVHFEFGQDVLALPGRVGSMLRTAKATDLKVLLALGAAAGELDYDALARAAGCTRAEAEASVHAWMLAGIVATEENGEVAAEAQPVVEEVPAPKETPGKAKPSRHDKLPQYTSDELAELLEKRQDTAAFLDECQNAWGKMFNTHEINIILGLVDYLGLEWEYVLSLLAYCQGLQNKRGVRRSLHYVETMAFGFYDEGVCTVQALYDKLRQLDQMAEAEGQLRTLFGMGDRSLTPQEKKYFSAWVHEFNYGMDIIRRAYEITVDTKGSPKMSYMNSILANWNRDGLRTMEQVEAAQNAFNETKKAKGKGEQSKDAQTGTFDTEDFFEAAVRRSLGEDFDPTILNTK